jgi:hypothetical protein
MQCVTGLALLLGCAGSDELPTGQGVEDTLIASGTARFHSSDKQHIDGRVIQNALTPI